MLVRNFEKELLRDTKVLFCWHGLECFPPLRGTKSKTSHYLLLIFFRLITLKGTAEAPALDLLRLTTLRGTKTASQTPKRYDKHPHPFYKRVPLREILELG